MKSDILPAAAFDQHIVVLGKTRSGKSSKMRLLAEDRLRRGLPTCIVDPKGDWWGVKLGQDGKSAGFPLVIFGGKHADVPINAHSGAAVAELWATGNRSCLIDLSGWMVSERTQFWIDFASTLFRTTVGERWLFVDEFHHFAPKGKVESPQAGKMLHWSNTLAAEGLGKGLRMVFASQRPQKVHNDCLTSAETLIACKVLHPADRTAVSDWIKGCGDARGDEVLASLSQLARAEAWAWSPESNYGPVRQKFPMFSTYDSFKPQPAGSAEKLKGWAEVDLEDVKAKLANAVQEAEANDPKKLRARIAELERQATSVSALKSGEKIGSEALEAARTEAFGRGEASGFDKGLRAASAPYVGILPILQDVALLGRAVYDKLGALRDRIEAAPPPERQASPAPARRASRPAVSTFSAPNVAAKIDMPVSEAMPAAQQRILNAAAFLEDTLGTQAPDVGQLALFAAASATGGYWRANIGRLRSLGLINGTSLTPAGRAAAQRSEFTTPEQVHQHVIQNLLEGAQRPILKALLDIYPAALEAAELGKRCGMESSGGYWRANIGRLRSLGLVTKKGPIAALPILFLER